MKAAATVIMAALLSVPGHAQSPGGLPSAPVPSRLNLFAQKDAPMLTPAQNNSSAVATNHQGLTRAEAEQMALKNNPRISVSKLLALAQHQVVREAHAAELPLFNGAVTAEKALDASRISAGSLTTSRLLTHAGAGGSL